MDPEIDVEVDAPAGDVGRGEGLDWTRSVTFDSGNLEKIHITSTQPLTYKIDLTTDQQVKVYLEEMNLSKYRTNHNIGRRVSYLRCSFTGCPYNCRLIENIAHGDRIPHFEIEIVPALDHNHQVDVGRERGLTTAQKAIVQLCIDRGQAAPKKVFLSLPNIN